MVYFVHMLQKDLMAMGKTELISLFPDYVRKIDGKHAIYKENTLIKASYDLSLWEHRLLAVVLSLITPSDADKDKLKYRFSVQEFAEFFGLNNRDIYTQLQATFVSLRSRTVILQRPGERKRITGWVSSAELVPGEGIVEVEIDEQMLPYLLQIKTQIGYTQYYLANVQAFKCQYAFRFYEYFHCELKGGDETIALIAVDALKTMLGITDQYSQYSDFKKRVLTPAIRDINASPSDLRVGFAEKKSGKKVSSLEFKINHIETIDEKSKDKTKINIAKFVCFKDRFDAFGFKLNTLRKLRNSDKITAQYVEAVLMAAEFALATGKLKNPAAFLRSALENGWTTDEQSQKSAVQVSAKEREEKKTNLQQELDKINIELSQIEKQLIDARTNFATATYTEEALAAYRETASTFEKDQLASKINPTEFVPFINYLCDVSDFYHPLFIEVNALREQKEKLEVELADII